MDKRSGANIEKVLLILGSFIFLLGIFSLLSLTINYNNNNDKTSTIYTSCFDNQHNEYKISYDIPSYQVNQELNKPSFKNCKIIN